MKATEIKVMIKRKFKNMSRFSVLSKIPYSSIQGALKTENPEGIRRILTAINDTDNRPIKIRNNNPVGYFKSELDEDTIKKVEVALAKFNRDEWCFDNGVDRTWLSDFLTGEIRFYNRKVDRLCRLLGVKPSES